MNFPETLDDEDMKLAMKEWRLSGLDVRRIHGFLIVCIGIPGRGGITYKREGRDWLLYTTWPEGDEFSPIMEF